MVEVWDHPLVEVWAVRALLPGERREPAMQEPDLREPMRAYLPSKPLSVLSVGRPVYTACMLHNCRGHNSDLLRL